MTRPDWAKLGYIGALVALFAVSGVVLATLPSDPVVRIAGGSVLVLLLLVPGRVQAWLLREHFAGWGQHRAGDLVGARERYARQLAELEAAPWKNHAVWLGWMIYTVRADAMVWNNVAAVCLDGGDVDGARAAAERALELDPLYPLPWVNLAGVAAVAGESREAAECVARARELGFRGTVVDERILAACAAYARVQGGVAGG